MLALDSLVIDLIFAAGSTPKPDDLLAALGGEEVAAERRILDPDAEDPRFEIEVSPSIPMRRRGERRLLVIDESVAPMREDPRAQPIVPLDLSAEKERLIALCEAGGVRIGRLNALGSWGDAVLCCASARDLRAVGLMMWALDPTVDIDGNRRRNRLSQQEFEAKLLAYEKRLDELGEKQILASLGPARLERRGKYLVVDVLEEDGTWDVRKSWALQIALASVERFSRIPGAPSLAGMPTPGAARPGAARPDGKPDGNGKPGAKPDPKAAAKGAAAGAAAAAAPAPPAAPPPPKGPPLSFAEHEGRVVLVFPRDRFDLDVAAALGKRDWWSVIRTSDALPSPMRDRIQRDGAGFVAPLDFLSEVFLDGKPLSKPIFEAQAKPVGAARGLEVHCPRFGPVLLLDLAGRGRFITSELGAGEAALAFVPR